MELAHQEPHSLLEVVVALMETFSVRISDIAGFMNQIISAITTTSTAAAAVTTTRTSVTSGTCVDLTNPSTGTSDCTRMASYCFNSFYLTLMRQQCPRTCGYCKQISPLLSLTTKFQFQVLELLPQPEPQLLVSI